jgi:hypothetical protein
MSSVRQQSVHKQQSEVEEIKDFRKLHRANCFIFFLHLALLSILFFVFVMWQMQPSGPPKGSNNGFLGLVFDPETQTFVFPGMQNGTKNGTNANLTVPDASITNILRDFILSSIGSSNHQQPFQKPQDRDGR